MGGKQSVPKPVATERDTIQMLHKEIDKLNKTIQHKKLVIEREHMLAVQCAGVSDKLGATTHLRNKKRESDRVETLTKMLFNLETQLSNLETLHINTSVLKVTSAVNSAIKSSTISTEEAEAIMDEVIENSDKTKEITGILSTPIETFDVEDELRELVQVKETVPLRLPEVPTTIPVIVQQELRQLVES